VLGEVRVLFVCFAVAAWLRYNCGKLRPIAIPAGLLMRQDPRRCDLHHWQLRLKPHFGSSLAYKRQHVFASAQVTTSLSILCYLHSLTARRFNQQALIDTTPLPEDVPKVKELGASSAPLLSASFFIGARCKAYNDDYMMCKTESNGRGELECMKEGRKVTRCAASV